MTDAQMPENANVKPVEAMQAHEAMVARIMLRVLSGRAVAAAGVLLVFAMGCWVMWNPSPLRAMVAGGFAVFSLLIQMLLAWAER